MKTLRPSIAEAPVVEVMTEKFDTEVCHFRMSRLSDWIVRSVNPKHVVERRRENFTALQAALRGVVQPVFDNQPDGVCPLFYAIKVVDNIAAMTALRAKGVEACAWWYPTHPRLAEAPCAEAEELRRRVVVIPCHEDMSLDALTRISEIIKKSTKTKLFRSLRSKDKRKGKDGQHQSRWGNSFSFHVPYP